MICHSSSLPLLPQSTLMAGLLPRPLSCVIMLPLVWILAWCPLWTYIAMNFNAMRVHVWKGTSRWSTCGLPWLHIEMDEERLSRLPCGRVLSFTEICRRGRGGGTLTLVRGSAAAHQLWLTYSGDTAYITVGSGCVCKWLFYIQIHCLKIWLTIRSEGLLACLGCSAG